MFSDMKTSLESSLYLFKFLFHILFLSIASHIFILLFLVAIVAICCEINVSELENTPENGGLGLPNISVKADSLLMKQMCRMLSLPNEDSFHMVGYWLGGFLHDTGLGENFPQLAEVGPVSHTMTRNYPLHSICWTPSWSL